MDVAGLILRLRPEARARFDHVWSLTFYPDLPASPAPVAQRGSHFSAVHASLLNKHHVSEAADGPGPLASRPFTVYEERSTGARQRFILWTEMANGLVDTLGYKAHVPGLQHISNFLPSVLEECASGRDFRTGFYQIPIPRDARHLFRFVDATGKWWQLTRLPMGHCCSVELMQTLGAAAAGHPEYVTSSFVPFGVRCDMWVDNIRFVGPRQHVRRAMATLTETARQYNITWKPEDSFDESTSYDFIGVRYDHLQGTVVPTKKLLDKLNAFSFDETITAGDLERLVGRLIHASAIAGTYMGDYWFPLKYTRRIVNGLNRGTRHINSSICLPPSVRTGLAEWILAVQATRHMSRVIGPARYTAFVDASTSGWGGVIIDERTNVITVLGAKWPPGENLHINVLEAKALALTAAALPAGAARGRIRMIVDNTTVQAVARKGICLANLAINEHVVTSLKHLRALGADFTVEWVRSADNPADAPSRIAISDFRNHTIDDVARQVFAFLQVPT